MQFDILIAGATLAAAVTGQIEASPAERSVPATATSEESVKVALDTSAGQIVIALDRARAPRTTANFLHYVDNRKYDGESFYRAMPYGDGGLIQGGVTSDARKLAKPVAHEPTSATGLRNVAGSVVMANTGPGTARADFFILTTDVPAFNASATDPGFAVFGRVVEGMDIVRTILAAPVSATKGEGAMKGQMLDPVVRIRKAVRLTD